MGSSAIGVRESTPGIAAGTLRPDILLAIAAALAMFLLASATPDIPSGFDAYRHAKMSSRIVQEGLDVMKDPWRLAHLWRQPVDPYIGFHMLLIPFTSALGLIPGIKLMGALIFGGSVFVILRLLHHFSVERRLSWTLVAVAGSGITLHRLTISRPFVLAIFLVLLVTLLTLKKQPLAIGIVSAIHSVSYSMFFLVAMAPGVWLLMKRDRAALKMLLACAIGMAAGVVCNPYFPQTLYYVLVNAGATEIAARAGVEIGGELWPMNPGGFLAASIATVALWLAAILHRLCDWKTLGRRDQDMFLAISAVALIGAFRVGRTFDFFVPFAALFAAVELAPWANAHRKQMINALGAAAFLCALNVLLTLQAASKTTPVENYRGVSNYLREHAPGDLVINAHSSDYYYLYYWNTANRYFIGIEPTFTYILAPEQYWLWRHLSNDETSTCRERVCPDADRMDVRTAMTAGLGSRYLLTQHAMHSKLEASLTAVPGANPVYRDSHVTLFRFD